MMSSTAGSLIFGYDASGLRTWRVSNTDYTEYTYIGTTLVSQDTDGEVINFSYTASGAPYGFTLNGTSYFYLLNLQGDVIGIYDSNGNIVVQYVYDSWGKLISITGSLADTVGVKNPLRYRGYYYDTLSGLYYLQSRYYDPETGRFISSDTLLIAGNDTIQGTNLFAYCYNNPIMYSDPTGRAAAYHKDMSDDGVFVSCLIGAWALMIGELQMSPLKAALLTLKIDDAGDLAYVAEVMYNGKQGNKKAFLVCKAFTKKSVCKEVAKWYSEEYPDLSEEEIAQEIYANAIAYYYSDDISRTISSIERNNPLLYYNPTNFSASMYILMEAFCGDLIAHADPIDIGGNRTVDKMAKLIVYPIIWELF